MARLVGLPFRVTAGGSLAATNAIAESSRTAATATPVALMLAINVGMVQSSVAASDLDTEGTHLWSLWVMIGISVGFAAIAIVNTTAMTIVRRRSQLASIRLAGATPGQARRSSEVEALIGTLAGSLIGMAIAAIASWSFAVAVDIPFAGMFQWALIFGLIALAAVLGFATATVTAGSIVGDPALVTEEE